MHGFGDMTTLVLPVVTDIQEYGILTIAELRRLQWVYGFHATQTVTDFDGQQSPERTDKCQDQYGVVTDEFDDTGKIHPEFPLFRR